jgi:hypothetical protein
VPGCWPYQQQYMQPYPQQYVQPLPYGPPPAMPSGMPGVQPPPEFSPPPPQYPQQPDTVSRPECPQVLVDTPPLPVQESTTPASKSTPTDLLERDETSRAEMQQLAPPMLPTVPQFGEADDSKVSNSSSEVSLLTHHASDTSVSSMLFQTPECGIGHSAAGLDSRTSGPAVSVPFTTSDSKHSDAEADDTIVAVDPKHPVDSGLSPNPECFGGFVGGGWLVGTLSAGEFPCPRRFDSHSTASGLTPNPESFGGHSTCSQSGVLQGVGGNPTSSGQSPNPESFGGHSACFQSDFSTVCWFEFDIFRSVPQTLKALAEFLCLSLPQASGVSCSHVKTSPPTQRVSVDIPGLHCLQTLQALVDIVCLMCLSLPQPSRVLVDTSGTRVLTSRPTQRVSVEFWCHQTQWPVIV